MKTPKFVEVTRKTVRITNGKHALQPRLVYTAICKHLGPIRFMDKFWATASISNEIAHLT